MVYNRELINNNTLALDPYAVARSSMANAPYYTTGNSYSNYRITFPFNEKTEIFTNTDANGNLEETAYIYLLLTGFPPNIEVGMLNLTQAMEFTPNNANMAEITTFLPPPHTGTRRYLQNLFSSYKMLPFLKLDSARNLCEIVTKKESWNVQELDDVIDSYLMALTSDAQIRGNADLNLGGCPCIIYTNDSNNTIKSLMLKNN